MGGPGPALRSKKAWSLGKTDGIGTARRCGRPSAKRTAGAGRDRPSGAARSCWPRSPGRCCSRGRPGVRWRLLPRRHSACCCLPGSQEVSRREFAGRARAGRPNPGFPAPCGRPSRPGALNRRHGHIATQVRQARWLRAAFRPCAGRRFPPRGSSQGRGDRRPRAAHGGDGVRVSRLPPRMGLRTHRARATAPAPVAHDPAFAGGVHADRSGARSRSMRCR